MPYTVSCGDMLRLILILLLPLTCFGQGFGSFTFDQPYLAKDAGVSTPSLPTAKLAYWWVASDLSSSPVATWTDRIQGAQLTQGTGANQPTWATNGVSFNGSDEYLTAGAGVVELDLAVGGTGAKDALVFIGSTTEAGGTGVIMWGDDLSYLEWPGNRILYFGGTSQTAAYAVNQSVDCIWDGWSILTNGVLSVTNTSIAINETSGLRYVGVDHTLAYWWAGTINELCIYTNIGTAGFDAATKTAIHKYATNTYTFLSP